MADIGICINPAHRIIESLTATPVRVTEFKSGYAAVGQLFTYLRSAKYALSVTPLIQTGLLGKVGLISADGTSARINIIMFVDEMGNMGEADFTINYRGGPFEENAVYSVVPYVADNRVNYKHLKRADLNRRTGYIAGIDPEEGSYCQVRDDQTGQLLNFRLDYGAIQVESRDKMADEK